MNVLINPFTNHKKQLNEAMNKSITPSIKSPI